MTDQSSNRIPGSRLGSLYPHGSIIAHLAGADHAAAVEAALHEAGWASDDVVTASGEEVISVSTAVREGRSFLQRLAATFPSEESQIEQEFDEAAARGEWAIMVKADTDDLRDRARAILREHRATGLRHYGDRVITDL